MNYDRLKNLTLSSLALMVVSDDVAPRDRYNSFEMMMTRLGEIEGGGWLNFDGVERGLIKRAMGYDHHQFLGENDAA